MNYDIVVIGAGASGLFIGSMVKEEKVLIIEKNNIPGKKLAITGKGRCNITNIRPIEEFFHEVFTNPKFLYSSFYEFTNLDLMKYLEDRNLFLKKERGGRIFPLTDKATDVIEVFLKNKNAKYHFNEEVISVSKDDLFIIQTNKSTYKSKFVIIATGGVSYPMTGSTGDGYKFAKKFGHKIIDTKPALVGINIELNDSNQLMGLTLRNIELKLESKAKTISEFGELLFTHYGISGPTVLRLSPFINPGDKIFIDLKPALTHDILDLRVLRDFKENNNKFFKNSLDDLLPKSIIDYIINRAEIDPYKKTNQITNVERKRFVRTLKSLDYTVKSRRGYNEAVITDGGIDVKQVNPKTMESNLVKGLYFVGEVLDVAANTGGYNLQIAFSTSKKAYKAIMEEL